jgi:hypothetical protein
VVGPSARCGAGAARAARGDLQPAGPADPAVEVAQAFPAGVPGRRRRPRRRAPSGPDTGRRPARPAVGRGRSLPVCRGRHNRAAPAGTPGGTETTVARLCTTLPATTQQLPNPMGLKALRGAVVMPRHPAYFLPGPCEQGVVDGDREYGSRREQAGHDQISPGPIRLHHPTQRALVNNRCARL